MRGGPSIFVWEVRCKSSRTFSLRLTDLWSGDFSSFLQPSTQTSSIFLACEFLHPMSSGSWGIESHRLAQLEYTKKQGTRHLHSAVIFELGYTKK
ncbi:hypothetical protein L3X38_005158 [Prunus dulcis]|uniref:Uncharacterized protein n=1 Tax=Prunus dulcis TaxID=3755 RepID=A0AAD4ZQ52_PRUDU|nr:hypothetical protein L3X38_005158 [Prunus dulcis]